MASVTLSASTSARTSRMEREVLVVTERLLREFGGQRPPAVVLACIADCDALLRATGVRNGLAIALESMVAARLREPDTISLDDPQTVRITEPLPALATAN